MSHPNARLTVHGRRAAAPDFLDTVLCSIRVRKKGPSCQRRIRPQKVSSSRYRLTGLEADGGVHDGVEVGIGGR